MTYCIAHDGTLYIETPFGEAFYARITRPSWVRAGLMEAPRHARQFDRVPGAVLPVGRDHQGEVTCSPA